MPDRVVLKMKWHKMCKSSCPPKVEIVFSLQTLSFVHFIHFNFPWELFSDLLAIIIQLLSKMTVLRVFQRNLYHQFDKPPPFLAIPNTPYAQGRERSG